MSKRKQTTRSSTLQFLIGQPSPDLPEGLLPTFRDTLRDVMWKKAKIGNTLSTKDIVSCSLNWQTPDSTCHDPLGCVIMKESMEDYCTVEKIKGKWRQAGIETVSDRAIRDKIVSLTNEYQRKIKKRRNRQSKGALEEREKCARNLDKCFNVSSERAKEVIENDKKRSAEDKARDLDFLSDQLGERKMVFTIEDKRYKTVVMSAQMRELAKQGRIQREKQRAAQIVSMPGFEADSLMEAGESQDDDSVTEATESQDDGFADVDSQELDTAGDQENEDTVSPTFQSPVKKKARLRARKIKDKTIPLQVPLDIMTRTSPAASRLKLSVGQHSAMVSAFIVASGGDLDDFPVSLSSSRRERRKSAKENAEMIKEKFKTSVNDGGKRLVVHFDGKMMDELGSDMVKKDKKDRLAVLIRSPDLEDKEQLLGIPQLDKSTGLAQQESVSKLLDEWGASDSLIGVVYDTTASNSGNKMGSVTRLERKLQRSLLKMPCRRHIHELHAKHVAYAVSGRETTGPGDVLFKTFSSAWDELKEEIDYNNLCKFDWNKHLNTKLETKAHSLLRARSVLADKLFPRADYLQLAQLTVIWHNGTAFISVSTV